MSRPAPFDPDGKRELTWRPDGNGMSFLQLEPARKEEKKVEKKDDAKVVRKDRVMQWLPPFGKDDVKVVYESPNANYRRAVLGGLPVDLHHADHRQPAADHRHQSERSEEDLPDLEELRRNTSQGERQTRRARQ